MVASSSTMSTRGRPGGGTILRDGGRARPATSRPLRFQPGIDVALAETPLPSDAHGRNLPRLDEPIDRPQIHLEVFEYLLGRQKAFVHHAERTLSDSSAGIGSVQFLGQFDREDGAAARVVRSVNGSAVLLDDSVGNGEAQARSATDFLGREERVEDPRQHFSRNAVPAVADCRDHPSALAVRPYADENACRPIAGARGMFGVDEDVEESLVQQQRITADWRQIARVFSDDLDRLLSQRSPAARQRSRDDPFHPQIACASGRATR